MLPIYIICHADCDHSAYLCEYLDRQGTPYEKVHAIDDDIAAFDLAITSGLVIMGGRYSVTADHDWIEQETQLIQRAIEKDVPLMGVCFGAQMISKALGAEVCAARYMEAGWHTIRADTSALDGYPALGLDESFEVFEWHEDTFSIPEGAVPIFFGDQIESQGYLYGKVLAMQFHLEMTEYMVLDWLKRYCDCLPKTSRYVQSPEQMTDNLNQRLDNLHAVADKIYGWWLSMVNKNN